MKKNKGKKLGLTTWIFIALLAGAITGIVLHYLVPGGYIKDTVVINGVFYVLGNGFLRLMQMLVVPLVFCSLICGSAAIGDTQTLGKVGVKTIGFYIFTTAVAVTLAIAVASLINPGMGLDISSIQQAETTIAEKTSFADTLLNIIPKNPIQGLAEGNMLQVIVFALLIGIILAKLGEKADIVSNFFSQFNDIMMEMTTMVMKVAPIGVFCLIAKTFAGIGFNAFLPMLKYMGLFSWPLASSALWFIRECSRDLQDSVPSPLSKNFCRLWALLFRRQRPMRPSRCLLRHWSGKWEYRARFPPSPSRWERP